MSAQSEIEEIRRGLEALGKRVSSDPKLAERVRDNPDEVLPEFGLSLDLLAPHMKADDKTTPRMQCQITCFKPWPTIRCTSISVLV